jgi:preprotein translocase subunit YajC
MFGVFYFILIRPQVKRQREQQEMLKKLDKGDMILTRGGLIGKITGSSGDIIVVELQEKVRVRMPRAYIEARWDDDGKKAVDMSGKAVKAEKPEKADKADKALETEKVEAPAKADKSAKTKAEKAA